MVLLLVEVREPLVVVSLFLLFTVFYRRAVTDVLLVVCLGLLAFNFLEVVLVLGGFIQLLNEACLGIPLCSISLDELAFLLFNALVLHSMECLLGLVFVPLSGLHLLLVVVVHVLFELSVLLLVVILEVVHESGLLNVGAVLLLLGILDAVLLELPGSHLLVEFTFVGLFLRQCFRVFLDFLSLARLDLLLDQSLPLVDHAVAVWWVVLAVPLLNPMNMLILLAEILLPSI